MRAFVFVSLCATMVGTAALAYDPYPFQRSDGKWGYVNDDHCWVIAPQFGNAGVFSEGLAPVFIGRKQGFIDQTGAVVINPQFVHEWRWRVGFQGFSEGLAAVRVEQKWGFIGQNGAMMIYPQFDLTSQFSDGVAAVQVEKKWGFIDRTGAMVINPQFEFAGDFSDGLAAVPVEKKWGSSTRQVQRSSIHNSIGPILSRKVALEY